MHVATTPYRSLGAFYSQLLQSPPLHGGRTPGCTVTAEGEPTLPLWSIYSLLSTSPPQSSARVFHVIKAHH